ncbi:MAG: hypothetical protein WC006_07760 [Bacilli bacterium]
MFDFTQFNDKSWEQFIDNCYRLRYQSNNYQKVPARYMGDCGIEGYTNNGIAYQCYYPDDCHDDEYYEKLRDKMTTDLKKLINNGDKLKKIGIIKITQWHFVIPEYRDKRILEHKTKKLDEIKLLISSNVDMYNYMDENLEIVIKEYLDFKDVQFIAELLSDKKYCEKDFISNIKEIDYYDLDDTKVNNVKRKCLDLNNNFSKKEFINAYRKVVNLYMNYYSKGICIINSTKDKYPFLYEKISESNEHYREKAILKASLNVGNNLNKELLDEIITDFKNELKDKFNTIFNNELIDNLATYLVSSWIADCSLSFS